MVGIPRTDYTSTNPLGQGLEWLTDPANWTGPAGIPVRTLEHLQYTGLALLIAALIAVPLGLLIGHTGRGQVAVVAVSGLLRALPTLGMLTLFVLLAGLGLMPPIWSLVLLAVPPLLAGTYAGVASVDRTVVDAARSLGMNELQVLFRVEVPNGMRVILGGLRGATLQVVATAAVVATINLGGLGRYLIDGLALGDYGRVFGGAVIIALLALAVDAVIALGSRFLIPSGLGRLEAAGKPTGSGVPAVGAQGGKQ
ncbi:MULTISPECIES: ABC transporter permease [unclassified Arthrobacter]|uniref:ABC transporter permease n=1 Tax=unclassified Arthrobacter TaxID=235627 RepID=UPI001D13E0B2|nr:MULTISPECIES: ABC transporter permease subunit [unclassified Arthrobacter]MCC3290351.1 ABC transporter permease subunit [Arthrobacter sp. zg-Y1110]MCC3300138.1 ABC transporter permease subunit [Arthrobacter sp. zg-Y895]UWX84274.1 ABC transporter permease subunit [Arthrobacter sp. zg-Y1110]